jgi:hypothetical protein
VEPLIVNSDPSLQEAIGRLREDYTRHRYLKLKWTSGKKRSLDQNAQIYVWYEQLARELREDDKAGWRRFCKLTLGVRILRLADPDFRAFYDKVLKHLPYELKLEAMDYVPVTSLMSKPQLSEYHKAMQDHFMDKHRVELKYQDPPETQAPSAAA